MNDSQVKTVKDALKKGGNQSPSLYFLLTLLTLETKVRQKLIQAIMQLIAAQKSRRQRLLEEIAESETAIDELLQASKIIGDKTDA